MARYTQMSRCSPIDHEWEPNTQFCQRCGISKQELINEAHEIIRLNKEGKLGRQIINDA